MNGYARDQPLQKGESPLRICSLSKEEFQISKDAKFSPGIQVSCPYLYCSSKNSQFQHAGRFPSEFVLNHLHSSHKHRRFNGDSLDMTMVVPQVEVENGPIRKAGSTSNLNGADTKLPPGPSTTQTWPFVEVYCNKRYFYLEAQSYIIDGHAELFLWLWFLGSDQEEVHYKYHLTVIHGKSEYSYKGPVISLMRSSNEVRNEGRCLVIREKVWDYMSYKLKIIKVWCEDSLSRQKRQGTQELPQIEEALCSENSKLLEEEKARGWRLLKCENRNKTEHFSTFNHPMNTKQVITEQISEFWVVWCSVTFCLLSSHNQEQ